MLGRWLVPGRAYRRGAWYEAVVRRQYDVGGAVYFVILPQWVLNSADRRTFVPLPTSFVHVDL